MTGREGAIPVLNDPQFGLTAILRPYIGFDSPVPGLPSYQGLGSDNPVLLSEGGISFDPLAGQPGYDVNLLKGTQVPFGARVSFWLPIIAGGTNPPYDFQIIWRQRNVFDYRRARLPFHYPKQSLSQTGQVMIPAASQGALISTADTVSRALSGVSIPISQVTSTIIEKIRVAAVGTGGPAIVTSTGTVGTIQQGLGGLAVGRPGFLLYDVQAVGDEFLLTMERDVAFGATWDFGGVDAFVTLFFSQSSNPDDGAYVNVGVAT